MVERMSNLTDLRTRFQAATSPDRDLDARLHVALFPDETGMIHPGTKDGSRGSLHGRIVNMDWASWEEYSPTRYGEKLARHHDWPAYTGSMNEAILLYKKILPEASFDIHISDRSPSVSWFFEGVFTISYGSTAGLAIINALLDELILIAKGK